MGTIINNVLALIDRPGDSDLCFRTAIGIANRAEANLHISYRRTVGHAGFPVMPGADKSSDFLIWGLHHKYRVLLSNKLFLHIRATRKNARNAALDFAGRYKIDLVIIWNHGDSLPSIFSSLIRSNGLSKKFGCPVLSLHELSGMQDFRNIALPLRQPLQAEKLMLAVRLARIFDSKIHLFCGMGKEGGPDKRSHILKSRQILQDNIKVEMECKSVNGIDFPRSVINHCLKVNADLIELCPGKDSFEYSIICL